MIMTITTTSNTIVIVFLVITAPSSLSPPSSRPSLTLAMPSSVSSTSSPTSPSSCPYHHQQHRHYCHHPCYHRTIRSTTKIIMTTITIIAVPLIIHDHHILHFYHQRHQNHLLVLYWLIYGLVVHFNTGLWELCFSSVQHSVVSDSLQPHEPQHARPPYPSPTHGAYPNPHPLCQWCHPTISSSVIPFSSCPQSFPQSSGSFQMSQLFASAGQSIGVPASTSVLPMNIQDWFPLGLTGWISLQSKGLSRVFSNTKVQKHQFFGPQHFL